MKVATIDMGTNTIRLLIADLNSDRSFKPIYRGNEIARIGRGFGKSNCISREALEKTIKILKKYRIFLQKFKVSNVYTVATSAVREASNNEWFVDNISRLGFKINVINSSKEAYLTHKGIVHTIKHTIQNKRWLAFDLGGGSTEFIISQDTNMQYNFSIPFGVVKLLEMFIKSDPPDNTQLKNVYTFFSKILNEHLTHHNSYNIAPEIIVGNAGTITTLSAIDLNLINYSYKKTENYILKRKNIEQILNTLISMNAANRLKNFPVLQKEREDVIVVGIIVVLSILDRFFKNYVISTNGGLIEGALIEHFCLTQTI